MFVEKIGQIGKKQLEKNVTENDLIKIFINILVN